MAERGPYNPSGVWRLKHYKMHSHFDPNTGNDVFYPQPDRPNISKSLDDLLNEAKVREKILLTEKLQSEVTSS